MPPTKLQCSMDCKKHFSFRNVKIVSLKSQNAVSGKPASRVHTLPNVYRTQIETS